MSVMERSSSVNDRLSAYPVMEVSEIAGVTLDGGRHRTLTKR